MSTKENSLLDIPIHIMYGSSDEHADIETTMEWQEYFTKTLFIHKINGNHMYINENPLEVKNILGEILKN